MEGGKTLGRFKTNLALPVPDIRKQHLLHMDPQVTREAKLVPEEGLCQVYPTAEVVRTSGPSSLHAVGEDTELSEDFLFPRGLKDNKSLREEHLGDPRRHWKWTNGATQDPPVRRGPKS